jgi:hypothetical protein
MIVRSPNAASVRNSPSLMLPLAPDLSRVAIRRMQQKEMA